MGQRVVGQLLVVGPERSVGTCGVHHYGISFHRKSLPCFQRPWLFHGYMIFAFAVVLMTYFGVNYLLGGMHSYANS